MDPSPSSDKSAGPCASKPRIETPPREDGTGTDGVTLAKQDEQTSVGDSGLIVGIISKPAQELAQTAFLHFPQFTAPLETENALRQAKQDEGAAETTEEAEMTGASKNLEDLSNSSIAASLIASTCDKCDNLARAAGTQDRQILKRR
jgi:hypothetical protein